MKHEILIHMRDGCPEEVISGLPKNWKLVFRSFDATEEDRMALFNESAEDEDDKYYFEYTLSPYCGEIIAPKLVIPEFERLYKLVKDQVVVYGRQQFRSTLQALEKCLGY